jgi:hypothetical protein
MPPANSIHQYNLRKRDAPMTIRVGSGSAWPTEANMLSNTGITNSSSTMMAIAATLMMTDG